MEQRRRRRRRRSGFISQHNAMRFRWNGPTHTQHTAETAMAFQYRISYTSDNPLMSNRCLLNVSSLISSCAGPKVDATGPSSSSVSFLWVAFSSRFRVLSRPLKRAASLCTTRAALECRMLSPYSHAPPVLLSITDISPSSFLPFMQLP